MPVSHIYVLYEVLEGERLPLSLLNYIQGGSSDLSSLTLSYFLNLYKILRMANVLISTNYVIFCQIKQINGPSAVDTSVHFIQIYVASFFAFMGLLWYTRNTLGKGELMTALSTP